MFFRLCMSIISVGYKSIQWHASVCLFPAPHSMTSCWEHASGLGEGTAQKCTHGKSGLDFSLQSPLLNIHQRCAAWKPQSVPSTGSHRSPPLLQGSRAGSTDPASHWEMHQSLIKRDACGMGRACGGRSGKHNLSLVSHQGNGLRTHLLGLLKGLNALISVKLKTVGDTW